MDLTASLKPTVQVVEVVQRVEDRLPTPGCFSNGGVGTSGNPSKWGTRVVHGD